MDSIKTNVSRFGPAVYKEKLAEVPGVARMKHIFNFEEKILIKKILLFINLGLL